MILCSVCHKDLTSAVATIGEGALNFHRRTHQREQETERLERLLDTVREVLAGPPLVLREKLRLALVEYERVPDPVTFETDSAEPEELPEEQP